jgi:hypothetical protein
MKNKNMKKQKLTLATFLLTCLAFNASNQDIKSSTAAFGFGSVLTFQIFTLIT